MFGKLVEKILNILEIPGGAFFMIAPVVYGGLRWGLPFINIDNVLLRPTFEMVSRNAFSISVVCVILGIVIFVKEFIRQIRIQLNDSTSL